MYGKIIGSFQSKDNAVSNVNLSGKHGVGVGDAVVGERVGCGVGNGVGSGVGWLVGLELGATLGALLGLFDGLILGSELSVG